MGFFTTLIDSFVESKVEMPLHAAESTLKHGVAVVESLIADNRRKEEEKRREEELEKQNRKRCTSQSIARYSVRSSGVRFSIAAPCDFFTSNAPSFSAVLKKHVRERCDGKAPMAYKRAGIDRKLIQRLSQTIMRWCRS